MNKKKRVALPLNGSTEAKLSNVLKVGIETNQTRSFKFDGFTLVKVNTGIELFYVFFLSEGWSWRYNHHPGFSIITKLLLNNYKQLLTSSNNHLILGLI